MPVRPSYESQPSDSTEVAIRYRVNRHEALEVRYRIERGRARVLKGPSKVDALRFEKD